MRLSFLLAKKVARDIKANIIQYIAIILIASLAISLFLGLAASYHTLNKRVSKLYTNGNVSDLSLLSKKITDRDYEKIKNIPDLKSATLERRTIIPVNISADRKPDQIKSKYLDYNFSLVLNKNNTLNRATNFYNEKHEDISSDFNNHLDRDGIFLPSSLVKIKIGTMLNVKMSYRLIINLINSLGYRFEKDSSGELTGRILKRTILDDGKINWVPLEIMIGSKKFDFSKESFNYLNTIINASEIKGESDLEKDNNNLFSFKNYLALLKKLTNSNSYLNMKMKLAGYIDSPESIDRNAKQKKAFINKDYFANVLFTYLKSEFKKELALISELSNATNNAFNFENSRTILDNYYTSSFFTSGFLAKIKLAYSLQTSDKQQKVDNFFNKLANLKDSFNNYYNQVLIKLNKPTTELLQSLQDQLNAKELALDNQFILSETLAQSESNKAIQSDLVQSYQLMLVFPVIFFLVAFLMIISTSIQMVIKERTHIATMKALGISKHTIYRNYISRTIIIISIGVIIGVIAGPMTLPYVVNQKYKLLYNLPKLELVFPWLEMLAILFAFYVSVAFIIFLILRQEMSLMPAKSMRPKAPEINIVVKSKKIKANKIPQKMAFRNIRINKFRSLMTVIGVAGTCALLLVGLGIQDTLDYGISHDMSRYYKSDMAISYKLAQGEVVNKLRAMDEVKEAEEFYSFPALLKNNANQKTIQSLALGFYQSSNFYHPDKGYELNSGECNISKKIATSLNLKEGDLVSFTTIDNREFQFKIKNIIKTFFVQGIIFNYQALTNDPILGDISGITQICYLNLKDSSKTSINTFKAKLNSMEEITSIITQADTQRVINNVMSTIKVATYTILFFAIALAVVVLYNLAQLNLNARKRELATMKVLGFNFTEITRSLLYEVLFLTMLGIIIGLLLGLPTLYLILKINETPVISYLYHISWQSYMLAGSAVILTAFILMQYIGLKNRKIEMIKMLKSVE